MQNYHPRTTQNHFELESVLHLQKVQNYLLGPFQSKTVFWALCIHAHLLLQLVSPYRPLVSNDGQSQSLVVSQHL